MTIETTNENVSEGLSKAALSHRTYVTEVLKSYSERDLIPGDPNEGIWHEAHYPVPRRLGGTETILLLREHHAVQGVLQSEEYGVCCFCAWERKFLPDDMIPLWKKWAHFRGKEAGAAAQFKAANAFWAANPEKRKNLTKKANAASVKSKARPILIEDTNNNHFMLFDSLPEAARTLDLCPISLARVARGDRKTLSKKRFKAYYV